MLRNKNLKSVESYIDSAPEEIKPKLRQLRATIRKTAPGATELISYGMPTYKYSKPFIGFAAMKNHIGLYPYSGSFVAAHKNDLADYSTTPGAIHIPLNKPLPLTLITKIVKLRIKETKAKENN